MPDSKAHHSLVDNPPKLFRATTINPAESNFDLPLVRRSRILDMLNRLPNTSSLSCIVGPIGSGKTTLAIQWAQHHGQNTQYIYARDYDDLPSEWLEEPNELGTALADLLNVCAYGAQPPSERVIREHFSRVVELSQESGQQFILDDLQLLSRNALPLLQPLMIEMMPRLHMKRALFISRTMDSQLLTGLQASGGLRVVLPATLEFETKETAEAHRLGIFGSATLEQVLDARDESAGWITGMLASLYGHGGQTIDPGSLRNMLLNDMLLLQPEPIQNIVLASALIPSNPTGLWEQWFECFELPIRLIPATISQLPIHRNPSGKGDFSIIPAMRDELRDFKYLAGNAELIDQLLSIALKWYVENDALPSAVQLAGEQGLHQQLLTKIKPMCIAYAAVENWSAIKAILKHIPEEVLIQDADLTFWYFHGLVEVDHGAKINPLLGRVMPAWLESEDPLISGRAHLLKSWSAYVNNRGEEASRHGVVAYNTLPEDTYRERLWAAGSVAIADFLRGQAAEGREWAARANYEMTYMAAPSRWWHNNAGPVRFSWLSTNGLMNEAYDFASRQVRALQGEDDAITTRYLINQAEIETERHQFDSAEALLKEAGNLMEPRYSQPHHYRMAKANLARARGDFDTSWDLLARSPSGITNRFDQYAREALSRVRLALIKGDLRAAELLLSTITPLERYWPRFLGDTHPLLLKALIQSFTGAHEEAIQTADEVRRTAESLRSHIYWIVHAFSIMAYIHHQADNTLLRNQAIDAAEAAAGRAGFEQVYVIRGEDVRLFRSDEVGEDITISDQDSSSVSPASIERLTNREREVLAMVSQSLSNKEIAERMFISVSTVKNHLSSTYDKLGTNNRRGAVRVAKNLGLLSE